MLMLQKEFESRRPMGRTSELREVARLALDEQFPPYGYVTGRFPHPTSNPAGHSFDCAPEHPVAPDPSRWDACRPYLYDIDLFNQGYYWEAHEVWEGLWHACRRAGTTGNFLAGLSTWPPPASRPESEDRRAFRGMLIGPASPLQQTASEVGPRHRRYIGLPLSELIGFATDLIDQPQVGTAESGTPVAIVFQLVLYPEESSQCEVKP